MSFDQPIEKKVQQFCLFGSGFAFLVVLFGAFGAHALRSKISSYDLEIFQTGIYYQMTHALALFAAAWILQSYRAAQAVYSGYCFITGIFLFSGSLILIALTGIKKWGMITPLGGLLFLAGWALLAAAILKRKV